MVLRNMSRDATEAFQAAGPMMMGVLIIGLALAGYFISSYFALSGVWTFVLVMGGAILGFALGLYDIIITQRIRERRKIAYIKYGNPEALKKLLTKAGEESALDESEK